MFVIALLLLIIGLLAGLLAGLLGIGGGLVIVPALTVLLALAGVPADSAIAIAVATSLATMLMTSASSVWFHFRRGAVDWPAVARLGAAVACGAVAGAMLATVIPGQHLARVFALIAALIGLRMLLARRTAPTSRRPRPRLWWLLGPLIGAASALAGIGGGSFNVPYLVRNGYPMVRAVATAAACGWPIAAAGTLTFALIEPAAVPPGGNLGHIWLPGMLITGIGGVLTAPIGVTLAHRLPADRLGRLFGVVLLLVAVRMAW